MSTITSNNCLNSWSWLFGHRRTFYCIDYIRGRCCCLSSFTCNITMNICRQSICTNNNWSNLRTCIISCTQIKILTIGHSHCFCCICIWKCRSRSNCIYKCLCCICSRSSITVFNNNYKIFSCVLYR